MDDNLAEMLQLRTDRREIDICKLRKGVNREYSEMVWMTTGFSREYLSECSNRRDEIGIVTSHKCIEE